MCGIAWYWLAGLDDGQVAALAADARTCLAHRGPDATSVERVGDALWVFHRLAVVHLGPEGMQPLVGPSGSRLVCNGEIWNYRDLAPRGRSLRSDCDAVLTLLDACGGEPAGALASLDGDFAFVWQSGCGPEVVVAGRDRFGVRPLFYGTGADGAVRAFASEAKALVGAPGILAVHVFPPGHVWAGGRFQPFVAQPPAIGSVAVQERPRGRLSPDFQEAKRRVRELLTEAVRKRLDHSERPVGVLCSGGIDSAIVTCLAAKILRERGALDVRVFTIEYAEGRSADAFYARILCDQLGVAHTVFSFSRAEVAEVYDEVVRAIETPDPNTVRAAVPMYLLARKIAAETDVRVVLSGEGADELFHGYNYFRMAPGPEAARSEAARLVRQLHMFDVLRADRCMAAAGLELRVPFLDAALVEHVQGLPGDLPWGGVADAEKQLLRDAFSDVGTLDRCRILDRGKERFSDGCGFSYVPQLLDFVSGGTTPKLDEKLAAERRRVEGVFDTCYPRCRGLAVERTMPEWVTAGGGKAGGAELSA